MTSLDIESMLNFGQLDRVFRNLDDTADARRSKEDILFVGKTTVQLDRVDCVSALQYLPWQHPCLLQGKAVNCGHNSENFIQTRLRWIFQHVMRV